MLHCTLTITQNRVRKPAFYARVHEVQSRLAMHDLALRFLETLHQTQYLSPQDMALYQQRLLERLCRHAALETEFYRERLRPLFEGGDAGHGAFRMANWAQLPLFDRAIAQACQPQLLARRVPEAVGASRAGSTSGSSGRPLQFRTSAHADVAGLANTARLFENHGLDGTSSLGWIKSDRDNDCSPPLGGVHKGWSLTGAGGMQYTLAANSTIDHCIQWLHLRRPAYLFTYPSIAMAIARQLRRMGENDIGLNAVITSGENVDDDMAGLMQSVFGARHIDLYGTLEIGPIATQCITGTHKHCAEESVYTEILREDGTPAKPGEAGRVVVTPLYNYAMPMIRYDIGDFAVQGGHDCPCGSRLMRIEKVLGRSRNIFRFRDGSQRHPRGFSDILNYLAFTQIQIVQTSLDHVEVRYVADPARNARDEAAVTAFLRQTLHGDIGVSLVEVNALPRSASGKFEDFLSLVPAESR